MSSLSFGIGVKRGPNGVMAKPPPKKPATVKDLFAGDSDEEEVVKEPKKASALVPGAAVPTPSDSEVREAAEKLADFVAKNGRNFEDITRAKNPVSQASPFRFLHDKYCTEYKYYYAKLMECEKKYGKAPPPASAPPAAAAPPPAPSSVPYYPPPPPSAPYYPPPPPMHTSQDRVGSAAAASSSGGSSRWGAAPSLPPPPPGPPSYVSPQLPPHAQAAVAAAAAKAAAIAAAAAAAGARSSSASGPSGGGSGVNAEVEAKKALEKGNSLAAMEAFMAAAAAKAKKQEEDDEEERRRAARPILNETSFDRRKVTAVYREDGKRGHHMGDYIPPEELAKFMAKAGGDTAKATAAAIEARNAIAEDNIGRKLLSKMGWKDGEGVGAVGREGITAPIQANGMKPGDAGLGLGAKGHGEVEESDDIFEQYRKRMQLGYKYRPNPLGNPRKAYY